MLIWISFMIVMGFGCPRLPARTPSWLRKLKMLGKMLIIMAWWVSHLRVCPFFRRGCLKNWVVKLVNPCCMPNLLAKLNILRYIVSMSTLVHLLFFLSTPATAKIWLVNPSLFLLLYSQLIFCSIPAFIHISYNLDIFEFMRMWFVYYCCCFLCFLKA